MPFQPPARMQANTGLQAPESTWLDRLLSDAEQRLAVRVLHSAGFRDATPMASIYGLLLGAAGRNARRQKIARELVECCLSDAA